MRLPDFYIVGAPKCGTTALYSYLRCHPGVFMPEIKEPRFFSWDMPGPRPVRSEDEYCRLFADAPPGALIGEASPSYLGSRVAVSEIMRRVPEARIIVMLRNPIDMAHALYSHRLLRFQEDREDFEEAWALQQERAEGRCLPRGCEDGRLLQYREYCRFARQVRRIIDQVPSHNRMICILEDFASAARETYVRVLEFLGLADDGRCDFIRVNANRAFRSRRLAELDRAAERWLGRGYQVAKEVAKRPGWRVVPVLGKMNVATRPRRPLSAEFRGRLASEFLSDVRELEVLLGRRFRCWSDFASRDVADRGIDR